MEFKNVPDYKDLLYFLRKHGLDEYEDAKVIFNTNKDIGLELDFGDDEIVKVNIRRRKGYNGNYRITMMG